MDINFLFCFVLDSQICSWKDGDDKSYKVGEKQHCLKNNDNVFIMFMKESCKEANVEFI